MVAGVLPVKISTGIKGGQPSTVRDHQKESTFLGNGSVRR